MVDWGGLENRCAFAGTVGSNPTLSASYPYNTVLKRIINGGFLRIFSYFVLHPDSSNCTVSHITRGMECGNRWAGYQRPL